MDIKLTEINDEKIFQFAICVNRQNMEMLDYQKRVFAKFGHHINQITGNYPPCSHGAVLEAVLAQIDHSQIDYYVMWENDSIPLRSDYLEIIYDKIKDKSTVMGSAQQSNHKKKWDGTYNHPYCATPLCISKKLYEKLGKPTLDHHVPRSDTYEEVSFKAEELGYNICIVWPRHTVGLSESEMKELSCPTNKSLIGQDRYGGYGTTSGDNLWYHQYFSPVGSHAKMFIDKCKEVLNE